ncbi:MAG TPA: peptidoglycan-binding domain-containing protein [Solirubrobacteraceae bacterium]|nr:peptidoglycan-binding domain-containing protein [Solirubrobacteraceae bacterium]
MMQLRTLGTAGLLASALALAPAAPAQVGGGTPPTGDDPTTGAPPPAAPPPATGTPHPAFSGTGMWIWQIPRTERGSVSRIVARARRHNVTTLFVKSGDGINRWRQFSPQLVGAFKKAGLRVCGWQYVYGNKPIGEANVAAWAKQAGADCFVIDAEAEYEGKYVSADLYVRRLRALVGESYPLALAPFPYVDYHPAFPYSVFLAPGAAEANQPQMYWKAIGTSVDRNFAHTYTWNRLYKRPIFPLGQTYDRSPPAQVRRFRQVARAYGAGGLSWWEWNQTSAAAWTAVSQPVASLTGYRVATAFPTLRLRSRGDFIVWAQQHLWAAGYRVPLDGVFNVPTRDAVLDFQQEKGLPATGALDDATWRALLVLRPAAVRWQPAGRNRRRAVPARASGTGRTVIAPRPASASLPARGREIAPRR